MKGQKENRTVVSVHADGSMDDSRPGMIGIINLQAALELAKKSLKSGAVNEAKRIYEDILKIYPQNKMALDGHK